MLRKIFDFYYSGFTSMDIGKKSLACHYHKTCDNISRREAVFHA